MLEEEVDKTLWAEQEQYQMGLQHIQRFMNSPALVLTSVDCQNCCVKERKHGGVNLLYPRKDEANAKGCMTNHPIGFLSAALRN